MSHKGGFMKQALLILSLIFLGLGQTANASTVSEQESATLYQVEYFDASTSKYDNFSKGKVTISYVKNTISFELFEDSTCPAGAICVRDPAARILMEAPIVSKHVTTCGTVVFEALEDTLLSRGSLVTIKLLDTSRSICQPLAPAPTMVEFSKVSFIHRGKRTITGRAFGFPLSF